MAQLGLKQSRRNTVGSFIFQAAASGAVKEVVGRATGDVALERQGRRDQRESHLKDAGEKIKGAFRPRGPHGRQTKARRD